MRTAVRYSLLTSTLLLLLTTSVRAEDVADVKGGRATLVPTAAFGTALSTAEVTLSKIKPGNVSPDQVVSFRATGGQVDLGAGRGEVVLSGGIQLVKNGVVVSLTDFTIGVNTPASEEAASVTALATANGIFFGRVAIASVSYADSAEFDTLPLEVKKNKLTINDVGMTLTNGGAETLNELLEAEVFTGDTPIATVQLSLVFAGPLL